MAFLGKMFGKTPKAPAAATPREPEIPPGVTPEWQPSIVDVYRETGRMLQAMQQGIEDYPEKVWAGTKVEWKYGYNFYIDDEGRIRDYDRVTPPTPTPPPEVTEDPETKLWIQQMQTQRDAKYNPARQAERNAARARSRAEELRREKIREYAHHCSKCEEGRRAGLVKSGGKRKTRRSNQRKHRSRKNLRRK